MFHFIYSSIDTKFVIDIFNFLENLEFSLLLRLMLRKIWIELSFEMHTNVQ